ncbi:MAG: DUF4340 domain-containing protein [Myxococcales bacterium]
MNKNRLLIAVIVFLGLGGAAAAAVRSREAETTIEKPQVSLPTIKKDEITSVEIDNPKKGNVTLSKAEGGWSISAPLAAKADQSAVDALLEKLAELEVTGVTATRKENHARLEVDAAQALHVKVKQGDKQIADLYLGATKSGSTMVRSEGQDAVVSVKGAIRYAFDKDLKSFRDRVILDIDSKDLTGLSINSPKGTFKFEKAAGPEGKWTQVLAKKEKPIERYSDAKVQSLSSTFARLRASDFAAPDATPESAGLSTPSATVELTKADGSKATLELGKADGAAGETALRLVGNPVIFKISKFTADRFSSDASAFQEPEKKEGAAPAAPEMPDMAGGGGQQIPPELLRQLQQQLGAQGMGSPH